MSQAACEIPNTCFVFYQRANYVAIYIFTCDHHTPISVNGGDEAMW